MKLKGADVILTCVFGLFLLAALRKLAVPAEPMATLLAIEVPFRVAEILSVCLITAELYCCWLLSRRETRKLGTELSLVALVIFTCFLCYLMSLENPPPCGCGIGQLFTSNRLNLRLAIARNAVLILALVWARSSVTPQRGENTFMNPEQATDSTVKVE
jgi:hypothetical protein